MGALVAYMLIGVIAQATLPADKPAALEQRFSQAQAQFEAARAKMAAAPDDTLEARRMFRRAAESFAAIAADGAASANLYVNTGNAYHFAGDEPRALLWYLRASQRANTQEIRAGLATLRRVCKAELWPPARPSVWRVLMFWHYDIGRRLKQALLLTLYPAGCALAIVSMFMRRRKRWLRIGLVLAAVGGLMGASDAVAALAGGEQWAVVLSPAKGYAGDGQMYSVLVDAIAPGQEVEIVELRRDWMQVELPSGARCWVSEDACEPVSQAKRTMP
jgi:hypothetical protein